jgi:polyisoprenoid-binding protein YceI
MNSLAVLALLFSVSAGATELELAAAEATYTVRHLLKTVTGTSRELRGKMVCDTAVCEFLVAAPVKSFVSSDSNRDLNMQTVLEANRYPLVTVRGKFPVTQLEAPRASFPARVTLHGVEREYPVTVERKGAAAAGALTLRLEAHKIERPSLLTVEIADEVPVAFTVTWKAK